jgi:hypothetical protein
MMCVAEHFLGVEEINALRICGQDKAPGGSGLTARHLRRADIARLLTMVFYNSTFMQKVPGGLCKSTMIFIPKGDSCYAGTIRGLRPITLPETVQRIFIKTIFMHITRVLVQKLIPKGSCTSVLPGTLTYDSLLLLAVFLEEFHRTNCNGHLFLEDRCVFSFHQVSAY